MADQAVISLVVDLIVAAFDSDTDLFNSWLVRSRLETELAALQSQQRIVQTDIAAKNVAADTELAALAEDIAAKLAEIDAL